MTVQDDAREQELCNLFNLDWDPRHARGGTDAVLDWTHDGQTTRIEFEVKSTTTHSVSTARDVGMAHIARWRTKHWVIGFYSSSVGIRARLNHALYLTPTDMRPWIDELEAYIAPDVELARCLPERLTEADLVRICEDKPYYTIADARRIMKKQWTADAYTQVLDHPAQAPELITRATMLDILRHRAGYTMERGATLNNPHVTKSFLARFDDQKITRDHAGGLRRKLADYLKARA
jgi:hypothetical protein